MKTSRRTSYLALVARDDEVIFSTASNNYDDIEAELYAIIVDLEEGDTQEAEQVLMDLGFRLSEYKPEPGQKLGSITLDRGRYVIELIFLTVG